MGIDMDELLKAMAAQTAAIQELAGEVRSLTQQNQSLILALAEQDLDELPASSGYYLDGTPR